MVPEYNKVDGRPDGAEEQADNQRYNEAELI